MTRTKEDIQIYQKKYREENKQKLIEYRKNYYLDNTESQKKVMKDYYENNKQDIVKRQVAHCNLRRKYDANFRLSGSYRTLLRNYVLKKTKVPRPVSQEIFGCNQDFYRGYLESRFLDDMSWDNYSFHGWHIDHIVLISFFDLTDKTQVKQCFHYSNTQPLWCIDNIKKSDRI